MKQTMAVGLTVLAGAALLEAALIPGILIGGAAVFAPKYLSKFGRKLQSQFKAGLTKPAGPKAVSSKGSDVEMRQNPSPTRLSTKQAIVKTITFRIIVTTLDFSVNYVVIGEFATAAGLSGFSLVVGPIFYFVHEMLWNKSEASEFAVKMSDLGFALPRALVKTITFRTIATTMDFTTNYVVVSDIVTAMGLSASGAILGPFIYFGHEKLWEHYRATPRKIEERRITGSSNVPLLPMLENTW